MSWIFQRITGRKFFIIILLLSFLIPIQAHPQSERSILAVDGQILDIGGSIKHIWLDHSIIPPLAFDHPLRTPSRPTGPTSGMPSIAHNYSVSASDLDGDQLSYTIDWGDGTTSTHRELSRGTAAIFSHSWSKAGIYHLGSKVEDCHGLSSEWSDPLIVVINSPPSRPSSPVGQTSGKPCCSYSFSTSANDPDGDDLKYTFDWGDKSFSTTNLIESGKRECLLHAWAKSGIYRVNAKATDGKGASSEWSDPITIVINTPPNRPSPPLGPQYGYANAPYCFLTSATDPDQDVLAYTFDWGDGLVNISKFIKSGINVSSTHAWNRPGTYFIRVSAADSIGGLSNWSEKACIVIAANDRPDPPRDLYGSRSGYTGIACTYFTMAQDPNGDHVRYTIDWGDGNTSMTDYVNSGSLENASHIWSKAGKYIVKARAIDSKGAPSSFSEPFPITIAENDPPDPPVMPSGPASGQCQISYDYATSAIDPDGDQVKYVFDWGDGTTSWTGLDFVKSGKQMKIPHEWTVPGTFRIKAVAMDDKGSISNWSNTFAVNMIREDK